MATRILILLALTLTACGPTMVVLKNPANGEVAQCKGDAWANWASVPTRGRALLMQSESWRRW